MNKYIATLVLGGALLAVGAGEAPPGAGAEPATSGVSSPSAGAADPSPTIEIRLAEARTRLAAAESVGEGSMTNAFDGVPLQDLASRRTLLSRLVLLLEQQLGNASELQVARNRRADVTLQSKAWTRFPDPPPYSILLTDHLREEAQAEEAKIEGCQAALSTLEELMSENRAALNQAEEKLRQLNEQLEGAREGETSARLTTQRELQRLRSQVASATLNLLEIERQVRAEVLAESRIRLDWRRRQLVLAEAGATFPHEELNKTLARIDGETRNLEQELTHAQSRLTNAVVALNLARQQAPARSEGLDAATARSAEVLAARQAQFDTAQLGVRTLRLMLETENVERAMWEMRYAAHNSRKVSTLRDSERLLESFTRRANLWKDFQLQQLDLLPSQIELQETRVRSLAGDPERLPIATETLAALRERDEMLSRVVRRIEVLQHLGQRWAEGIQSAEKQLPLLGRVQSLFSSAGSFFQKLWNFELLSAEDTIVVEGQKITGRRSITLGKIVMAVTILVLGIWFTGLITRITEPVIVRRLKIEPNQARLIRRWLRAFMLVCLAIFSLVSVKIPLTVFAFAGGALAIGLGFGMQTLLKNFVSGLILLFERPFRVGDVLQVGQDRGLVTEIGLRSSVLQLWDGTETLIPNSSLLESNVSNWTYSNQKVRFSVSLGVAYGSDTRQVMQLLTETLQRHGVVEKDPPPQVLFADFGESALGFEVRYWVNVLKGNPAQVGSDLRHMIAGAFAENGIVMAFPQRDLHLDAVRPLPVEIVSHPNQQLTQRPTESI